MIVSFGNALTADLFHGRRQRRAMRVPPGLRAAVHRKFDMLNAAQVLEDLRVPPGNRLEALKGDRKGWHSVRVNDQWRIVFRWTDGGPADVMLDDYH
jgi:proteic killer suppression protein